MKLIKKNITLITGWNEGANFVDYQLSTNSDIPVDDEEIDSDQVRENDVVFETFTKYESLGEISIEEIMVLKKFHII